MRFIFSNCFRVCLVQVQSTLKVQTLREEIWDRRPFGLWNPCTLMESSANRVTQQDGGHNFSPSPLTSHIGVSASPKMFGFADYHPIRFFSSGNYVPCFGGLLTQKHRQTIRKVRGDMKNFTFAATVDTLTDLIHFYNLKTRDVISYIYCICNG